MKYLFLGIIQMYWYLIPTSKRPRCIFKESCSNHVFNITKEKGYKEGFRAFRYRYKNCRKTYTILYDLEDAHMILIVPNGDIIAESEIAEFLK